MKADKFSNSWDRIGTYGLKTSYKRSFSFIKWQLKDCEGGGGKSYESIVSTLN